MALRRGKVHFIVKNTDPLLELPTALTGLFEDTAGRCTVSLQERDLVSRVENHR